MDAERIITRAEAQKTGLKSYFTGRPCNHGHVASRLVSNRSCSVCCRIRTDDWIAANREHYLARAAEKSRDYRKNNKAKTYQSRREWAAKNREKDRAYSAEWRANNKSHIMSLTRKRQAAQKLRTPPWFNKEHLWMVKEAYELTKMREKIFGFKWHVDHIVPLQGKIVSGLHVPWNLQVIPASENIRKGNRWDHA